jgi:predicted nucleic acid-binding protein
MTTYLLDTTVLIDLAKGVPSAREHLRGFVEQGDGLAVCAVTVAEFYSGIRPGEHTETDRLIGSFAYWDISRQVAMAAGELRLSAAGAGRRPTTTDMLIAALALSRRAVVLSDDTRHYAAAGVAVRSVRSLQESASGEDE